MTAGGSPGPTGSPGPIGSPGPTGSPAPGGRRPPGWKLALALLSLAVSLTLWWSGLVESLNRPSVGGELNVRQLELAVLAAPQLPSSLRPLLSGGHATAELAEALDHQIEAAAEAGAPAPAALQLEHALLLQRLGNGERAQALLRDLADTGSANGQADRDDPAVDVARRLLRISGDEANGRSAGAADRPGADAAGDLAQRPLLRVLSCEALAGGPGAGAAAQNACGAAAAGRRAALQLVTLTLVPAVVLLAGTALLLIELWQRWRGRATPLPRLASPPLGGVDAVLLIAGGFVVIGELLTPALVSPAWLALLELLGITSPLREGFTVVVLYLALMAGPLLILALMLASLGAPPEGGWLQFRWRPLRPALLQALRCLLMVLPLVTLVGWVQGELWSDPGGSNPLLDLVLRSQNPLALGCFGLTAMGLAPLFEETIFRGVLLPVTARELGPGAGVLISAAVFAVAHLSLSELLPLFMLGLGLGWLRLSSGRLASSVLMHALWNGLTFANLVLLGH